MTFEGFDAALVIESAAFWAGAPPAAEGGSDQAGTLDAALRAAGLAEPAQGRADCGCAARAGRAAARAEAMLIDLWIGEPGDNAMRTIERPNLAAGTSLHALLAQASDAFDFEAGGKTRALRANYIKPQPGGYVDENGNGQYDEGELIVVTGKRPKEADGDGDPPSGGDNGGGGDSNGPGVTTREPNETPCVEEAPTGVDLKDINRQALAAANEIHSMDDEHYEYGVIVFEKDGVVGRTEVFTDLDENHINWNGGVPGIPDGARILAIIHNHPASGVVNPGVPSSDSLSDDWDSYDAVVNWGGTRGITVDSNLLMYIYTDKTEKMYVYDKTDRNTSHLSCSL